MGFRRADDCMLWRVSMYLNLDWDINEDEIHVPGPLRNPFKFKVADSEFQI